MAGGVAGMVLVAVGAPQQQALSVQFERAMIDAFCVADPESLPSNILPD